ncbi:hypothetical protein PR048_013700 [Dryococelus australis]|uniref:PiggyBac transposable element-derived protein domain-containing protein n=1 Tax=Dryococelus australis TaxID=614101 RepID=A0ABQ9HTR0_9NEOP|nr:hypothetical protein PR048_013700 [Dryococelus australis]
MHPPRLNIRNRWHNIVTHLPGVRGVARETKSIIYCRKLRFRIKVYTETEFEEVSAVLGLLYMAGINNAHHTNLEELWVDDGTSPNCFRTMMYMKIF